MQKWKIIVALVAVAALTLTIIGLVATQTATPNPTTTNPEFWGWVGNCFRFRTSPPTAGTQVQTPTIPSQPSSPSTTTPSTPYQGGYYANGYGPCWVRG
jgi:hypothetical protein